MKKEITWADVASFLLAEIHDNDEALLYMERELDAERKKTSEFRDKQITALRFRDKQITALRRENEMLRKRAEANE